MTTPSVEFFVGLAEELSNVSLRRKKDSGVRTVLMTFDNLKALEKFNSFTQQYQGNLRLIDEEGEISVSPSSLKFIYGGDEGEELKKVECGFEIASDDHWDRFMRFMKRYAQVNGMGYSDKE